MCCLEPFLKMSPVFLLLLGLAQACIPREVAIEEKSLMSRLSPDGLRHINPSKMLPLAPPQVKPVLVTSLPQKLSVKRTHWNLFRCAYMMVTFLFVSYNRGDWCYCHYCNPEVDNRNDPCCAF
ncbi:hypothetical protein H1C71_038543 [Ictidomys tridecemlineatus]|nr:hypothetical protein H1C71_038543 [Ictidomys tridecemlineatus]